MVVLTGMRLAVGWYQEDQSVITVFDMSTGASVQVLTGFRESVEDLAQVEGHLLCMTADGRLHVWSESAAGTVRH